MFVQARIIVKLHSILPDIIAKLYEGGNYPYGCHRIYNSAVKHYSTIHNMSIMQTWFCNYSVVFAFSFFHLLFTAVSQCLLIYNLAYSHHSCTKCLYRTVTCTCTFAIVEGQLVPWTRLLCNDTWSLVTWANLTFCGMDTTPYYPSSNNCYLPLLGSQSE